MAKIVCISKYPPLQGGIAARTYWLTKALAERGHEMHVVTDAIDASPEYTMSRCDEPASSPNLFVYRPDVEIPWHIPEDRHRALNLLDTAVRVINEVQPDIIDTGYMVPYGIVGSLASRMTGVPFVLRHGGSDVAKFLSQNVWPTLFQKMFKAATLTITDQAALQTIRKSASNLVSALPYVPDPNVFNPSGRSTNAPPVLAIVGKTNYHWRHKGWHRVARIMNALGRDFRYLIVSQGKGLADFKAFMMENWSVDAIDWESFVPPWNMPSLFNRIDGLFAFERDLPFPSFSNLVLEALYSGTTVITDNIDISECYRTEGLNLDTLPGGILTVNASDAVRAAKEITAHFSTQRSLKPTACLFREETYERYVTANEETLLESAKGGMRDGH
jgi:glycosyltransferase involved in cell wall biosynthesis